MSDSIKFDNSESKFNKTDKKVLGSWSQGFIPASSWIDDEITFGQENVGVYKLGSKDNVNSPAHYTRGKQEAIEIIEEAIQDAPTPVQGMLQAQVLKYLLRLWLKVDSTEDAKKARWYLDRLIKSLEC